MAMTVEQAQDAIRKMPLVSDEDKERAIFIVRCFPHYTGPELTVAMMRKLKDALALTVSIQKTLADEEARIKATSADDDA